MIDYSKIITLPYPSNNTVRGTLSVDLAGKTIFFLFPKKNSFGTYTKYTMLSACYEKSLTFTRRIGISTYSKKKTR